MHSGPRRNARLCWKQLLRKRRLDNGAETLNDVCIKMERCAVLPH